MLGTTATHLIKIIYNVRNLKNPLPYRTTVTVKTFCPDVPTLHSFSSSSNDQNCSYGFSSVALLGAQGNGKDQSSRKIHDWAL